MLAAGQPMDQELEESLEFAFDAPEDGADADCEDVEDLEPDPELDLERIHREQFAFVWRTMRHLGVPQALLDDAVQDAFLVVHRRLDEFEGRSSLRTWLFGIARRVAYRYRRTAARQQRKLDALAEVQPVQASPYTAVAQGEALDILTGFLDSLDDAKREVFVLHTLEGVTGGEIASALGISVNTVHSRLRLARRSFERMCATLQVREERALSRARGATEPPAQARTRAWALLLPMIELPREGLAATGAWSLASQVKVFAATIAIGTASLGAVKVSTTSPATTPNVLVSTASAASSQPPRARPHAPEADVEPAQPEMPADEVDVEQPKLQRPARLAPARRLDPDPTRSLAAETKAMASVRAAVLSGDMSGAVALLDRLDRDHAQGGFMVERRGYRLIARCDAHPGASASADADVFVNEHAGSSIADQVQAACAD